MNKIGFWLAGMMLAFGAAHAEPPRMQLSITRPIGMTNGDICVTNALEADKPAVSLVLTEADVSTWDATTVTWTLDPSRIAGPERASQIVNHCYELAIDGNVISKGMVLSDHTSRLTDYPALLIADKKQGLALQLLSGTHYGRVHSIHSKELSEVFRNKPQPSQRP